MAIQTPFYRLYLREQLRKFLGINLKHTIIYIFKIKHKTYLSTDAIPNTGIFTALKVYLGRRAWYINIPEKYLEYIPENFKLLNTIGKVIELTGSEKIKKYK